MSIAMQGLPTDPH